MAINYHELTDAYNAQLAQTDATLAEQMPELVELSSAIRSKALTVRSTISRGLSDLELRDGFRLHGATEAEDIREAGKDFAKTIRHKAEVEAKIAELAEAARTVDRLLSDLKYLRFTDI